MGGLGRALGGLIGGIGKGMEQQTLAQMQLDRDEVMYRRQVALQNLGHQQGLEDKSVDQTNRLAFDSSSTTNKIRATTAELGVRGQLAAADDERTAARERDKDLREFQIWLKKQPIELQNSLTLEDFKNDREDARAREAQGAEAGRQVAATGVDANGNIVVLKGNDAIVRTRGIKPVPHADSFFLSGGATVTAGGGGAGPVPAARGGGLLNQPAPAPAVAAEPPKTYTVADLNEALAEAARLKAQGDPRFKDKTTEEIRSDITGWFRQRGLRLSTNGGQ